MVDAAHHQTGAAPRQLHLEMTLEAERLVPFRQQFVIDRSMHSMTRGAAFPNRFMLENKRAALGNMAFATNLKLGGEARSAMGYGRAFMRIVAIGTADPAFQHRMVIGQVELAALVQVTIKADLRRFPRIDNVASAATGIHMDAAGAVTGFTAGFE